MNRLLGTLIRIYLKLLTCGLILFSLIPREKIIVDFVNGRL